MTFQRGRDTLHRLEARPNRPPVPADEEPLDRRRLAVGPQGAQRFLDAHARPTFRFSAWSVANASA